MYERVLVAYRRSREPVGWAPGLIRAVAWRVWVDVVRRRMSEAGLVTQPERWLEQASFLPGESAPGRALVVMSVLAVGYFSVLPVSGSRVLLDESCVARAVQDLRAGGRAGLSVVRRYWSFDAHGLSLGEVRAQGQRALDAWRSEQPQRYVSLLVLNEGNRSVEPLGEGGRGARPLWSDDEDGLVA